MGIHQLPECFWSAIELAGYKKSIFHGALLDISSLFYFISIVVAMEETFPIHVPQKYSYHHSLFFAWKTPHFAITFTKSTRDQWHIFLIPCFTRSC